MTTPLFAADEAFDHSDWDSVLKEFVDQRGYVDYRALSKDRATFDRYVKSVQTVSPDSHPDRFADDDAKLAYWINAYNAQVFLGVLDLGVGIDSVWAGLISGRNFFVKRKIKVGGKTTSLKSLEDDIIRGRFKDPRIHAAVNCASISCPRLPQDAFLGAELDQQLDAAMSEFVTASKHFKLNMGDKKVDVSKIFDWFKDDFTRGGKDSLLSYINRYRPEDKQVPAGYEVDFIDYDKGLNRQ